MKRFLTAALLLSALGLFGAEVTLSIDTTQDRHPISPLAYGSNNNDLKFAPFRRLGGNRMTGYNWENNASSAGSDWKQSSDFWLLSQVQNPLPSDGSQAPGAVVKEQAAAIREGGAEPLVTLQMAGYVVADGSGTVEASDTAPSKRWVKVLFQKPGAPKSYQYPPNTRDDAVYMDEFVSYLVQKFKSTPMGKIKYYSLDNEPDIWSDGKGGATHPRLHPAHPTYAEVFESGAALGKAVLAVDPDAQILGPVNYGWQGFRSLQDAPDAKHFNEEKGYGWFLSYYLDQMRFAEKAAGKRLLHFYDLHYYSEAHGPGGRVTDCKVDSRDDAVARMNAPRSLWDPSYVEDSWITKYSLKDGDKALRLIPRVKESIARYYPGTKLSFTEWSFGGEALPSGGIAAADALGLFGREEVAACVWPGGKLDYLEAAFKLYLDYDGHKHGFADNSVRALSSDTADTPVYAASDSRDHNRVTVVAINRDYGSDTSVSVNFAAGRVPVSCRAYRFDSESAAIRALPLRSLKAGDFHDTLPKMSATLYEFRLAESGKK